MSRVSGQMVGTWESLRALLRLRWQMLRTRRARVAATVLAGVALGVLGGGIVLARTIPDTYIVEAGTLLPSLFTAVLIVAVLSGIAAGGGTEVVPASQLVSYPVSPRTLFVGSLLLAPLNLAWTVQLLAVLWIAGYISAGGPWLVASLALALLFLGAASALGMALSWLVIGARETARGRRATELLAAALVGVAVWVVATGRLTPLLDASPLLDLALSVIRPERSPTAFWAIGLLLAVVVGTWLGFRATEWTLRRREDAWVSREGREVRRRRPPAGEFRALLAVDHASVWRSRPLRRGILVLGLAPGAAAAIGGMTWADIVILPGLVASGAALLFGVNVFCLDGTGAAWLETTPRMASAAFWSKALVTAEVITVSVLITVVMAGWRAGDSIGTAGPAVAMAVVSGILWTLALGLRGSVRRPHKADLRGPRDTPAPPAAMALNAVRLSVFATFAGLAFSVAARFGTPSVAVGMGLVLIGAAVLHLLRTARLWKDDARRVSIVATVAFG